MPANAQLTLILFVLAAIASVPLGKHFAISMVERRFPELQSIPSKKERLVILAGASRWMAICLSDLARSALAALLTAALFMAVIYTPLQVPTEGLPYTFAVYLLAQFLVIPTFISLAAPRVTRRLLEVRADRGTAVCKSCGYDLRGQVAPICPECGVPFDPDLLSTRAGLFDHIPNGVLRVEATYTDAFLRRAFQVHRRGVYGRSTIGFVIAIALGAYCIVTFGNTWLTGAAGASVAYMIAARLRWARAIEPLIGFWRKFPDRTVTIEFREADVTFRSARSTSVTQWPCFTRLVEANDIVLLYLLDTSYFAMPRSTLDDQTLKMLRFKVGKQPARAESASVSDSLAS